MLRNGSCVYFCAISLRWKADDGLCAIDITNKRDLIFDVSTGDELSRAASLVLGVCVQGPMQQGGVAVHTYR